MAASTIKNNKPLKWATQRVNTNTSTIKPQRIHKRVPSQNTRTATVAAAAVMTAETEKDPHAEIERLQKELAFTYDTVATITVHFESLHHAYTSSKPQLDKTKTDTRLGEMEKELLTAYDDLGLQVIHLERKITKLEKRLAQLKEVASAKPVMPTPVQPSPMIYDSMSSPCSSTDSSISDYNFGISCDDYALTQMINTDDIFPFLPINTNDCNIAPEYYQELYCDLNTINTTNMFYPDFNLLYPSFGLF
jgi:hypothetical protein